MKLSHVTTHGRNLKAKKILEIISKNKKIDKKTSILSVGVGSGLMEDYVKSLGIDIKGVDVVDSRLKKSFSFKLIINEKLPFKENTFDIIISNHVIEHVLNQDKHLAEMKRTLKHNGLIYLATPNKYSIIEPHYKIPLLSWFNQKQADKIIRLFKRNDYFDILPLTRISIVNRAKEVGFQNVNEITDELLYFYLKEEKQINISKKKSKVIYKIIKPLVPTIGYLLK